MLSWEFQSVLKLFERFCGSTRLARNMDIKLFSMNRYDITVFKM